MGGMQRIALLALLLSLMQFLVPGRARAEDVAPGLAADAVRDVASDELRLLMRGLDEGERRLLRGIYVALDPDQADVLALPACDDDGDYVIVLSRALLDLVGAVAYASASDRLRHTRLADAYAELIAHVQAADTTPLPPPVPEQDHDLGDIPIDAAKELFVRDMLAWLVATELAHAVHGDVVCPHPTVTHERGDDVWTSAEHDEAVRLAPLRLSHAPERDAWAASRVLSEGISDEPARAFLRVIERIEETRPGSSPWSYVTLHPHARIRADVLVRARIGRSTQAPPSETSAERRGMR